MKVLVALVFVLSGCTSLSKKRPAGPVPQQVNIAFKGKIGETTETLYHSDSRTRVYTGTQVTHDRTEVVDFDVDTTVTGASDKTISANVKTVRKDGTVDLHDLAFPELGEEIAFILRSNGEIIKAGKHPPTSIYFVPSLPVPDHAVAVGDTWPLEHSWISGRDQIPLTLQVIGILKGIDACDGGYCADVEVSGNVLLGTGPLSAGSRFESRVWGRVLFSLDRGDVVWSEMRSSQEMTSPTDRTIVTSCMSSVMRVNAKVSRLDCEPDEKPVEKVPEI
jgi:hypothetical protein